jgi:hypothetical protein
MVREPVPDEAVPAPLTTESREGPPAAVARQAHMEPDRPSVVEDVGPFPGRALTLPEPELVAYRPRAETAPELRHLDHGPPGGPSRSVASPGPEVDRGPIVRVTIGRVEVRATQPPVTAQEAAAPTPAWSPGVLSLDDYLEQRKGRWR